MKRSLHIALALLVTAACGSGSGAPSGSGTPLSGGDNEPAPPSRDNPGSSREPPSTGQSSGSSSGGSGCPCAGTYSCGVNGADSGTTSLVITGNGASCSWSSGVGGASLQLGCNGMTTYQNYQYTSSWSGGRTIQLCANTNQGQTACLICTSAATPSGG